ncbi:MAG: tetratricopeptide repeat protein, partial [bacterium]
MRLFSLRFSVVAAFAGVTLAGGSPPAFAKAPEEASEAHSLLGSYLAGRIARGLHDTDAASEYYRRALLLDPGNEVLMEQALAMEATEGRWDSALGFAKELAALQPAHRTARLMLGLSEAKSGRFAKAQEYFKSSGGGLMGELTGALARAWTLAALGDVRGAMDAIDSVKQAEWAQLFLRYHKALIYDVTGRRVEARALFERAFRTDPKSLRIALAYAHHAAAAGDAKLARATLDEYARRSPNGQHPVTKALGDRIKAGGKVGLLVATPLDGLAEVFYGLGDALSGEGGVNVGAIYLQMAIYLKPDFPFAFASLASIYETTKKYDAAIATYDRIPRGTPLQSAIDIRKAINLNQLDRVEEAKD